MRFWINTIRIHKNSYIPNYLSIKWSKNKKNMATKVILLKLEIPKISKAPNFKMFNKTNKHKSCQNAFKFMLATRIFKL